MNESTENQIARSLWDETAGRFVKAYFEETGLRIHPSDIRGIQLLTSNLNENVCGCDLFWAQCPR